MRKLLLICSMILPATVLSQQSTVENIRIWVAPDNTRIVFDASAPIQHSLLTLTNPDRLIIDIANAKSSAKTKKMLNKASFSSHHLHRIRAGKRGKTALRIVLDLKKISSKQSFLLSPNAPYGHRLVIDLYGQNKQRTTQKRIHTNNKRSKNIIIAIDAGHGGEDPGAIGPRGLYEKDITLKIAHKLATLINKKPGFKAILTREKDYFIGLKKRIKLARQPQHNADLFVSIHADAFHNPKVSGSSVYILSNKGASSAAAQWLAERANASDLIGGINLDNKDKTLTSVIADFSRTGTLEASMRVANNILNNLKVIGKTHKNKVQSAGFAVLKSPNIPSILIEIGYISNPQEEKKLSDPKYQAKLTKGIFRGINSYFTTHPIAGTWFSKHASLRHTIVRGDTLSGIAQRYRVSMHTLRKTNKLKSDKIRVGQILTIPTT